MSMDFPNSSGFFGGARNFPVGPVYSATANPTDETGIKQRWAEYNSGSSKDANTLKPPLQKVLPPSIMPHNFLPSLVRPTNNHRFSWIA